MEEISTENTEYPRILVISNNSFSDTKNNGKTLASFFKGIPSEKIAQLYFNSEIPTDKEYNNYFQITDSEIVRSWISSKSPGKVIRNYGDQRNNNSITRKARVISRIKKYEIVRICREVFWNPKKWNTEKLNQWLIEFSPQIIFLCAGDSGFAYDIAEDIKRRFQTKSIIYITDDYILPRKTISLFWWIRRKIIYEKMEKAVQKSNMFITISEEMRQTYKGLFGIDSTLAMNMTESLKDDKEGIQNNELITLVYAGGLHFKRYKTLGLLAKAIAKFNLESSDKKAFLQIYSGSQPNKGVEKYLNIHGTSKYCGSLNQVELKKVLNKCDIPVHVESFDSKSIESTKLSISTKIPEYLSLGKPVLAIGPSEVASIKYLQDSAFCITQSQTIYANFKRLLNDDDLRQKLAKRSLIKYKNNHDPDVVGKGLKKSILRLSI